MLRLLLPISLVLTALLLAKAGPPPGADDSASLPAPPVAQKDPGCGAKDRPVIEGRSAGGLLMGAVAHRRPDLFHAALVGVAFVEVMNTMLDESVPLTVPEFEEWGNPKEKTALEYMITYSPYDNIENKPYPNLRVRTSLNDSQVMYWEPAKYVAKMRAVRTERHLLTLKTKMEPGGHWGASGRYDRLKDNAFDYAFFLTQIGIAN